MNANLAALHELGDSLATLYTAVNGRVGYDDTFELIDEFCDELVRLRTLVIGRGRLAHRTTVRRVGWSLTERTSREERTAEAEAGLCLVTVVGKISRSLAVLSDGNCGDEPTERVTLVLALEDVLDWACDCLTWGVTR